MLGFIAIFNPINPNISSTIKSSVNCLKNINVSSFHDIKLMQKKRQSPNLKKKKKLTKADCGEVYRIRLTVVIKDVNTPTIY